MNTDNDEINTTPLIIIDWICPKCEKYIPSDSPQIVMDCILPKMENSFGHLCEIQKIGVCTKCYIQSCTPFIENGIRQTVEGFKDFNNAIQSGNN